ncbi:MAG TPA: DUF4880 domain-containing protein [Sphingobium sp.]|uniref:FecR family protein n=1 Tax=Sphingobium sp. TaxID=1912891 RepID=UPI002ED5284E
MQDTEADLSPLMHEALNWIICLTSGSATQADARAFEVWRGQGPDHASAFREAATLRRTIRAMPLATTAQAQDQAPDNVVPFTRPVAINRRTMLMGSGGAIAASAAMLTISPPFGLWPSFAELNAGERTGIGERRTLSPMAGVTLEMNARTAISLDAKAGNARLVTGEAFASVTPQARALLVSAGGENWTVQGADANFRTSERETCITCLSGELVRTDLSVTLRAGQQYVTATGIPPRISPFEPGRSDGWRRGVLLFRQTPLVEVVEDINRYRSGTIILADGSLGLRPVSGMFHTDKIGNALPQLQQLLDLKVTNLPGDVVVLS